MGIKKWFFEPLADIFTEITSKEIIIEENQEKSKIILPHYENGKEYNFRPKTFKEYIGQEKIKQILMKYIKGTKKRNLPFPHTLISGKAGMGKTTLAQVIANELNKILVEAITSEIIEIEKLKELIIRCDGNILFLDEIHALPRNIGESMYPIMEDFKYEGFRVKPFTLIGATTELGEILRNRKPLYDRFKIILELEDYTEEEIVKILNQYKEKIFKVEKLCQEVYEIIAKNSRVTPRHAIRLLEATIYFEGNVKEVLRNFNIIKDGYTKKDLEILKYIASNEKGVGLQGIAMFLDTSTINYLYEIEPFLLKNGLIVRTPRGRKITLKGLKKIMELEKCLK